MSFRLELAHGNGRPRYWEVSCDYCEVVGSFPVAEFPDFPAAFDRAVSLGWTMPEEVRGIRYSCPSCTSQSRGEGG